MDFLFTPEQDEAAALAAEILADKATVERMKAVEAAGDRFDHELWATLGDAFDWSELDLIELARVLVEVGRKVAPVPLATHGACVAFLGGLGRAADAAVYAAAVAEERDHLPAAPTVVADAQGALTGAKTLVRGGMTADALLVTATGPDPSTDSGTTTAVYLVDPSSAGVDRKAQRTSDGDRSALITFTDAPAELLGHEVLRFHELLTVCAAAEQLGVTEGALALTSEYAKTREQFGRPIGTFQAVSQRLADGFIDVLGQRLTLWQAVWRLQEVLPAAVEVAVAKLWAADAGHRLAHTTVHVHGGVGIDLDGDAHRYFTAAKRFEFLFGGATDQALTIGRALSRT
ncbi:acyl-CoA dehydrogenase family protein [Nocardioides bizhenqiangii]|uniref:Acyl-CoA dehydrogenase n=1 Tax=Nocardioides bizhenqiangii TaxID=3095076 RepID=A0ABZ0ZL88_9ACTN|nr:acyl-CoA dehydrogenase [Nocardioides sp. HM61]WQQ24726.1 acyl-CoA dehydrogenase [Nocardioides sp. HM61]